MYLPNFVSFESQTPKAQEEWEAVSGQFDEAWQFPGALGVLDGKHVMMRTPTNQVTVLQLQRYVSIHAEPRQ